MKWPDQDRWDLLLRTAVARKPAPDWYERLTQAYGQSQRRYHNHQHIAECLEEFDQACILAHNPVAVELALWFHDSVYNPKAGNNEEESANLAVKCLQECGIAPLITDKVAKLVMATKNHETGNDDDAKLIVDVDLSILGRDVARFLEYEGQIRREYAWVPLSVFASKRAEILEGFLARSFIFNTERFRQKYEGQARRNLENSISRLRKMA